MRHEMMSLDEGRRRAARLNIRYAARLDWAYWNGRDCVLLDQHASTEFSWRVVWPGACPGLAIIAPAGADTALWNAIIDSCNATDTP